MMDMIPTAPPPKSAIEPFSDLVNAHPLCTKLIDVNVAVIWMRAPMLELREKIEGFRVTVGVFLQGSVRQFRYSWKQLFRTPPAVPSVWNPSQKSVQHSAMELRRQLSAASSYTLWLQKQKGYLQNVDLPPVLPKRKGKPFPIPIEKMTQAARKDKKLAERGIERPLKPPENGILVPQLVPIAYEVLDAWKSFIKGLAQLLHVLPVYGCR
ncbi:hypothetical protein Pint_11887 [Pistacia integerrima]|uniref:Uncharacterized protein n=1 Tax=Pistacia integerrima TaxID=434235 RepID=A0ACC0XEM3_9ROSI|nr:hypothetical protein Pint_11887 [Pistacia integerrima]